MKIRGFEFKKQFGQNFLRSDVDALALIEAIDPSKEDMVIEIGPGNGAVTRYLINMVKHVTAIEIDKKLVPLLQMTFEKTPNFELLNQDILDYDLTKQNQLLASSYKLIGSLPYNISKRIIDKFIREKNKPSIMSFIVQKEVAQNYAAKSPKGTFLSNYASILYNVNYVKTVDKKLFYPEPKVDGAIVQFILKEEPEIGEEEFEAFTKFLRNCFRSPRKKLSKVLKSIYNDQDWDNAFKKSGINELARAAELELSDFRNLFVTLSP